MPWHWRATEGGRKARRQEGRGQPAANASTRQDARRLSAGVASPLGVNLLHFSTGQPFPMVPMTAHLLDGAISKALLCLSLQYSVHSVWVIRDRL